MEEEEEEEVEEEEMVPSGGGGRVMYGWVCPLGGRGGGAVGILPNPLESAGGGVKDGGTEALHNQSETIDGDRRERRKGAGERGGRGGVTQTWLIVFV